MTDSSAAPTGDGLLDPMTRALTGLVLAVVGLLGPNVFGTAVQFLSEGQFGGGQSTYVFWLAVASAVPLGLAMWLALAPARVTSLGWVASVARSAVLVAALGLAGSALLLVGSVVHF
jgi:hypothetical protein